MAGTIDFLCTTSEDEQNELNIAEDTSIPICEGIPRKNWVGKIVLLHNATGVSVASGIYRNVSSDVVIGSSGPLGDTHVAVQILSSLCEDDGPDEWRYSVQAWPIELVHCSGASFRDHELRAKYNSTVADLSSDCFRQKLRPYKSLIRNAPRVGSVKGKIVLQQLDINLVASKDCYSKNCAQTFPREKIKLLRERMYVGTTFQF